MTTQHTIPQPELVQLAEEKQSTVRRVGRMILTGIYMIFCICIVVAVIYADRYGGAGLATGIGFLGAATVFALQNFIASFFTYMYITFVGHYDKGDVIRIGDPRMTSIGEVVDIGLFSTTIKEVDDELLFTGRQFTLPNQLFFTAGVYNYTRHNLLFWHSIVSLIALHPEKTTDALLQEYRELISQIHQEVIRRYPQWYQNLHLHHPKYRYTITDRGIEIEVRLNVHFYNILELNNRLACRLVDAHREGVITLVEHKDYKGVFGE